MSFSHDILTFLVSKLISSFKTAHLRTWSEGWNGHQRILQGKESEVWGLHQEFSLKDLQSVWLKVSSYLWTVWNDWCQASRRQVPLCHQILAWPLSLTGSLIEVRHLADPAGPMTCVGSLFPREDSWNLGENWTKYLWWGGGGELPNQSSVPAGNTFPHTPGIADETGHCPRV